MNTKHFPLYDPTHEQDACGVGFVAHLDGTASLAPVREALFALSHLEHRGARDADQKTGDGAGIMMQLPQSFFREEYTRLTGEDPGVHHIGLGMFFLPDVGTRRYIEARRCIDGVLRAQGFSKFVWRTVPTDHTVLGQSAMETAPEIEQVILLLDPWLEPATRARRLYLLRRTIEKQLKQANLACYVVSLSSRTVIYKGMLRAASLGYFYEDLLSGQMVSNFAIFHQRYSTNTVPSWSLAQPFRAIAHNGEINTLAGNRLWSSVRAPTLEGSIWHHDRDVVLPVLPDEASDSANLDAMLELMALSQRSLPHALAMLMPSGWEGREDWPQDLLDFYQFHACVMEPWDGPAAVVFGDGKFVGASLDRHGLRPARYKLTNDNLIVLGSEVGIVDTHESRVVTRGRLGPGQMIVLDVETGKLYLDRDVKQTLAEARPYGAWLKTHLTHLHPCSISDRVSSENLTHLQNIFGYSAESHRFLFEPMSLGKQPVGSMGDDTPQSILSAVPGGMSSYFRQRFAQVTNPPIDAIRERDSMSLQVILGPRTNWLENRAILAQKLVLQGPILHAQQFNAILQHFGQEKSAILSLEWSTKITLETALDRLCAQAMQAIDESVQLLVLDDLDVNHTTSLSIPVLLATSTIHHHLRLQGARHKVALVVRSGAPHDEHQMATLLGFGAGAIYPYLVLDTVGFELKSDLDAATRIENTIHSLEHGLLKVMARMGISTLESYRGAQLFDAVGLSQDLIDRCFSGVSSMLGGIGLSHLEQDVRSRHELANRTNRLKDFGRLRYRRGGEKHGWNPAMLKAINAFRKSLSQQDYEAYANAAQSSPPGAIRDLLMYKRGICPVSIDEVESIESICTRFTSAAMSLGSLSPETHQTLTMAMNRIGGKSNTGEGGEDPACYDEEGSSEKIARIKQVASGRFGVTTQYLIHAQEIEIKMAQGSKPGEGGQIPGHKVTQYIASLRRSTPGQPLISPPPHHDIYSIEDLAQLIYDLRQVNPDAKIGVKLVSTRGVGTIASGVVKAGADVILISGHEGGTGASPWSSIKHAGSPWELGLAETQQVLVHNHLRHRVVLRTDGGLKTGRDVVIAALLGAEEYNFGTAALVALGCRYVRQCHTNTCPVGIATQRTDLRQKYDGDVDQLVAFLRAIAQDIRQILAYMGKRSLQSIVGRTDLLRHHPELTSERANLLDLSVLMPRPNKHQRICHDPSYQHPHDVSLNASIVADMQAAIKNDQTAHATYTIRNTDRTVGATLAGQVVKHHGAGGMPTGKIQLTFKGYAGQSFGAFLVPGIRLLLWGEANDYVCKGMSGGQVVVRLKTPLRKPSVLAGNTILYGATSGQLFIAGVVGERFAVRNSGATAVVEGVGAHACEYMTRGEIVILGDIGENFGAGMTGGVAYLFDPESKASQHLQHDSVGLALLSSAEHKHLHGLLTTHQKLTGSLVARRCLESWGTHKHSFFKVAPLDDETAFILPLSNKPVVA